jgi:ADP-ribose pyrophosphatase YjhB (NUDIX family)
MILKLRRLLGLDNKQEKVENYSELHKSLMGLNERIDEIAEDFTVKNENYKQLLKSKGLSEDIAKSVQTRHINFVESHKKEIHEVLRERKEIKSKCDKLLSDPEINKAVKEIEFFDNLKNKYKSKEIGLREYDLILKAKTGKTKYSDILVYDKDGKLLLVQRDQHDNNGSKWGVPGGHVDAGEEFLEAAQRELFEETGIWVDELEEIAVYDKEGKEIHYFKVDLKEETQVVVQNKEGQDYKWIEYTELEDIEMPFNMKENLYKVLGFEEKEVKIIKAVSAGQISKELGEELIEKSEKIKGGIGDNKTLKEIAKKHNVSEDHISNQLEMGIKVEMEHTKDKKKSKEIAIDHLTESANYYTELAKMEEGFKDNVEKSSSEETSKEKEHLIEMIKEHERLIKVISPFAESSDAVKEELNIQQKELKGYKEKLKGFGEDEDEIEKARTGVYADNPENRRLKRVGKKYGEPSKQEEQKPGKDKKQEDKETQPKQSIEEYAKNSSQEALENASKGKDEELRVAAKKELKRRETEENESDRPEEKVSGEAEKKTGEESPSSDKKGEKDE